MSDNSSITISDGGTTWAGADAVSLYRAKATRSAIKGWVKFGMIPTRGVTITRLLQIAGEYTGKSYKRGAGEAAMADLTVWIDTMMSALPISDTRTSKEG